MSEVLNSCGRLAKLACGESGKSGESTCACGWLRPLGAGSARDVEDVVRIVRIV